VKKPSLKISGVISSVKTRMQKRRDNEEQERNLESSTLKMITFLFTSVAMALGMSFLPIFPQPLPILLAVLVAFVAFKSPRLGMPIGGAIIGIGLLFHLAELRFISFLGDTAVRVVFIAVWLALFIILPLISNRYKSALAIDFGILAVTMLFFVPTYFLAIPLILASAVYFKKNVVLSIIYYVLISVPLQIMQYYNDVVTQIVRTDWWLAAGSSPPLLVSLSSISKSLNLSVTQVRLFDISKVVYDIAGQTTWIPDWTGRTIKDALTQYLDSLPGLLMFVVIVVGLALTLIFFTRTLIKEGLIGKGDKLFQCFTATIAAALFFILLSALQVPLAFTADVSAMTMVLGILATLAFTLPVAFIDSAPKNRASNKEIQEKAKMLLNRILIFEGQLDNIKNNIPVNITAPEGKMIVIKDSLEDTLRNAENHRYEQEELDEKFDQLDKLSKDIDSLEIELNIILSEYHILATCDYSNWVGKLKDAGLPIKTLNSASIQKEMVLEQRIEAIKQVLESGRALANEIILVADPIYKIIRPLYDPTLPEKCRAIEFAVEKLKTKEAPWIVLEALFSSLNNWKRQYGYEIQVSMKHLQNSLAPIASLNNQNEDLLAVFGENTPKVLGYAKKAEEIKADAQKMVEKEKLDILDVITLQTDVQGFLGIANDVLTMLYTGLINDEEIIDRLLPTKDYLWEKNSTLPERLNKAIETLSNPSNYKINQIMENLPMYLSYINEAIQTLSVYKERKELLLNYPLAEVAIEERLKTKEKLSPEDLPFQPRFAAEYLRLYYTQKYGEYSFDKDNAVLIKRQ
jgi:hypothetical protein